MSIPVPLSEDHEVLGSEYCSGYVDTYGKWNTGFYCPKEDMAAAVYCCGTTNYKYCCTPTEQVAENYSANFPLFLGIILGTASAVIICTMASCFFCSICPWYKKRRTHMNGGPLYRMHCTSTPSGVASMYSFSAQPCSTVITPISEVGARPHAHIHQHHHHQQLLMADAQTSPPTFTPLPTRRGDVDGRNGSAATAMDIELNHSAMPCLPRNNHTFSASGGVGGGAGGPDADGSELSETDMGGGHMSAAAREEAYCDDEVNPAGGPVFADRLEDTVVSGYECGGAMGGEINGQRKMTAGGRLDYRW